MVFKGESLFNNMHSNKDLKYHISILNYVLSENKHFAWNGQNI